MPTIMDVAREAGVGIGTVSRVLNGSPLVSELTRERVLRAMDRLGYQPSPIARAFGRRRTDKLEVLVPVFAQSFVLEILRGIQDALAETEYTLLIRTIGSAEEREQVFAECCLRGRSEGVILVWLTPTESLIERLLAERFPAVLLNTEDARLWSVGVDHAEAAESAVTYCARLGHRRIALIDRNADPFEQTTPWVCRDGYERGMSAAGLEVRAVYERLEPLSVSGGVDGAAALLDLSEPPTAILAGSEAQAIGALEAARARGIRVPQDMSIIGYNDTDVVRDLGLTTVEVPLRELGSASAETLLLSQVESSIPPEPRYLPTSLVVRRTCAPPPN